MKNCFDGYALADMIIYAGGPNFFDVYKNEVQDTGVVELFFHDWEYINEFYTREKSLWWEKLAEIKGVQPGDTISLRFSNI